jgi:hypothetical protein
MLTRVGSHGQRTREPSTLIISNELIVSETALVQLGPLLLKLRSRPLARGLLHGHASTTLGKLGLLASLIRRATLAGANPSTFTRPRHKQRKRDQYQRHDNDHDDQCGRHPLPLLNGPRYGASGSSPPPCQPFPNNPRRSDPASRRSVVMTPTADRTPHRPQQNQCGADYDQNDPDHPQDRDLRDKTNQQQDNAQNNHKPSPNVAKHYASAKALSKPQLYPRRAYSIDDNVRTRTCARL